LIWQLLGFVRINQKIKEGTMKRIMALFTGMLLVIGVAGFASAATTKADAEGMVKKAIAFVKENGKEKGFAEISNPKGKFIKEDVYVTVYDLNGKCLAHGSNAKMVGKDLIGMKDPDGVAYVKERVEIAKSKGKGWQDYKFNNPVTKKIEPKTVYVEKYENLAFSAGVYK
jgi:signal transduction histidine kinase